ncbi:MAG: hypothetical protein WB785_18410 [Mycobacterium sp.]|uniref:hypothetical protein n=1 Tax=Mycobacterium sp. TaxID=1785 RepID=UPI003C3310B6
MTTLSDRRGWAARARMTRSRRVLVAAGVCMLVAACVRVAGAAPPAVLLVGSYQGIPGQFSSIQAAVDAARPGDWVLIGPGNYHETGNRVPPGAGGDDMAGAAVLVTTPNIWIRGMDRNGVVLDGTKPGAPPCSSAPADQNPGPLDSNGLPSGRNGLIVFKASGVSVENLTACNFVAGDLTPADEIWFDGGGSTGAQQIGSWRGAYLSATSTYNGGPDHSTQYGMYASNTVGPGLFTQVYANNMADAAFYIGACPNCNTTLDHAHAQNSAQGYSGTNSGGNLIIQNSEFDNNHTGFATNSQNNDDQPSPQSGHCPRNETGPTGTHSCWLFTHNSVHDNNNPNTPFNSGIAADSPVGTGILISGGRFDTVDNNDIHDNGAWGVLLVPDVDTEKPPPIAHCKGGFGLSALSFCYFDDWGNEIENNTLGHNGFFGSSSNVDLAEMSNLEFPGNCWHGNVDPSGNTVVPKRFQLGSSQKVTSDPLFIQYFPHNLCGIPDAGNGVISILGLQLVCNTQIFGACPDSTSYANYPQRTGVQMLPLPPQPSMPSPCLGVPRNPWCPGNPISQPPYPVPGSSAM